MNNMQKIKKIVIVFFFFLSVSNISIATQEEIIQSQSETLNIKGFVAEANKYTKEVFSDIDAENLLSNAIRGEIDNKKIIDNVLNIFGKEVKGTLKICRKYYSYYCNS